jgi:hypothetical protein
MGSLPSSGGQFRRLDMLLREHGYRIASARRSGHMHVLNAEGKHVYSFSGSPSCPHFATNTVRHMVRLGLLPERLRRAKIA